MGEGMGRLLDAEQIPAELWDAHEKTLIIPSELAAAFVGIVERRDMLRHLRKNDADGPIGGASQEETEIHFVNRLDGSLARIQLVLLDPNEELDTASDTLLARLSGGVTCIADAPCGAGAAVLSALAVVARLRKLEVLPRVPLEIRLVAADISSHARDLAREMLDAMRPTLEEQAINVSVEWIEWDATSVASNTHFVRRVVVTSDSCARKLLLVANFSGFLSLPGKQKATDPQLQELFRYFAGPESAALWLEPDHNPATKQGGVADWLIKTVKEKWGWFARISEKLGRDHLGFIARARFRTLLRGGTARVNACVVPVVLDPEL